MVLTNNQGDTALIILKDHSEDADADGKGDFDISNDCKVVEINDTSPISAKIILNAIRGRYITKKVTIQKRDRIYLEIIDKAGKKFHTVVQVKTIHKDRKNGLQLTLWCSHQSSDRLLAKISKPYRRISGYDAIIDAVNTLNLPENKGVKDPDIILAEPFITASKFGIRLNRGNTNNYITEAVSFEEFMDNIVDTEGKPPELGGSREFHYWRFQSLYNHSDGSGLNQVTLQVFEQGFQDDGSGNFTSTPNVTLRKSDTNDFTSKTLEIDTTEDDKLATNIIVIGDKSSGSWPNNSYAKFQGAKDAFRLTKPWGININYLKGVLINHNSLTFESRIDHTSTILNSPETDTITTWIQRLFTKPTEWFVGGVFNKHAIIRVGDIAYESLQLHTASIVNKPANELFWVRINFVPTTDYSPLTKGKAQYWINALGGWVDANTNNGKTAYIDHNSVIKDDTHRRTDVDGVYDNPANINVLMLKLIDGTRYPIDGLRILINGAGVGDFIGNDPNGVPFDDTIAVFRDEKGLGTTGVWYVLEHWGLPKNDDEVYDYEKGDSWVYKPCVGNLESDGTCSVGRHTLWIRGAYHLINVLGFTIGKFEENKQFDCVHPVKFDVPSGHVEVGNEKISDDDTDGDSAVFASFEPSLSDSRKIAGLNWTAMFPRNENNIPYGIVTIGEQVSLSVIDFLNKHKTHLNNREWFGAGVEDYMDMQEFAFFQKIDEFFPFGIKRPTGNYKMQFWLVDEKDNKVTIDYIQKKNGSTTPLTASLGKKNTQHSVPGISIFIRANEPEALEIFDFEKVRRGGIETAESFDEDDRFRTVLTNSNIIDIGRFTFSEKLKISLDAFRITKPLLVTNVDEPNNKPERNIPSELISAPEIFSYSQAKSLVRNLQPIMAFERDEYSVTKKFSNNLSWGDSVYYTDDETINKTTDGKNNTIKAVVSNNYISISKGGDDAPGGFRNRVDLITRLWSS